MHDRASTSGQPHVTADNVLLLQARSGDQRAGGASQVTGHGSRAVRAARLVLALALRKEDVYITCGPFHNREQTLVLACSTSLNGHMNDSLSGLSSRAQTLHRLVQKRSCHKKCCNSLRSAYVQSDRTTHGRRTSTAWPRGITCCRTRCRA
jgi:hypothetical protein